MPRAIPNSELDAICRAVTRFPDGASVEDIRGELDIDLPRRTLQRRLALLVEQGRLLPEGAGRGCRYRLPSAGAGVKPAFKNTIKKNEALAVLAKLKPELVKRFGVTRLALFGSTVRDEARPDSDVDIVVEFDGPATSQRYFGVQFLIEDELGHPVDLVSEKALRPELRPYIEREAINV
jgi:predicted nucleotidyltransferase